MKNIILIIFVAIAFIACKSKEEKEFLRLVSISEPYEGNTSSYFNKDGSLSFDDELYIFDRMYNQKYTNVSVAIYKPTYTNDHYAAIMIMYKSGIVANFFNKEKNYTSIGEWIEAAYINEQADASFWIAGIYEDNTEKQTVKNSGITTDLSKIKLVDFRVCSDKDVEKFIKSINSLSEKEREELASMFYIYTYLIAYKEYTNKDRFMDYYRKVKNNQTYELKFD